MQPKFRRKRGTETTGLHLEVTPEVKARIDMMKASTGWPQWAILEKLILETPIDSSGYPLTWKIDESPQQELPIDIK